MSGAAGLSQEASTVGAVLAAVAARLGAAGIAEPRREARLILALALAVLPETVLGWPERSLGTAEQCAVAALTERRVQGEPISRLRGSREFWSLDFALSPETLDPRPDSETLVAAALADIGDRAAPLTIVDFGTGTGCLLLALLSELPAASGIGIDILPGAVLTARRNAEALSLADRVAFRLGSWEDRVAGIEGRADVILANPPYIPSSEIARLAREVAEYEPRTALDGGADGLDAYRSLGPVIRSGLARGGRAYVEVGSGQAAHVSRVLNESGLFVVGRHSDLAGMERCVVAALQSLT